MSATIPTTVPAVIKAGQTLQFQLTLGDFPASAGWVLHFSGRSKSGAFDFLSTASGDDHLITVAAATTADWVPDDYLLEGEAVLNDQVFGIHESWVKVELDVSAQPAGTDIRTANQRILDSINATIEGRATHDILKSSIEGTVIERLDIEQLMMFRDRYTALVAAEKRRLNGQNRNIYNRFLTPGGAPQPPFQVYPPTP